MITVSAGEFAATVTKACLGASVKRGIALEIGSASMELSLLGQRPIPVLVEQFGDDPAKALPSPWEISDQGWSAPEIVSLSDAVSMIDFAAISDAGSRSGTVHAPAIVLGLALNRMRCHDLMLEVLLDNGVWTSVAEAAAQLSGELESCSAVLRRAAGSSESSLPNIVAINVLDDDWSSLEPWVAKTLVKADETNRADAGAGNTDND